MRVGWLATILLLTPVAMALSFPPPYQATPDTFTMHYWPEPDVIYTNVGEDRILIDVGNGTWAVHAPGRYADYWFDSSYGGGTAKGTSILSPDGRYSLTTTGEVNGGHGGFDASGLVLRDETSGTELVTWNDMSPANENVHSAFVWGTSTYGFGFLPAYTGEPNRIVRVAWDDPERWDTWILPEPIDWRKGILYGVMDDGRIIFSEWSLRDDKTSWKWLLDPHSGEAKPLPLLTRTYPEHRGAQIASDGNVLVWRTTMLGLTHVDEDAWRFILDDLDRNFSSWWSNDRLVVIDGKGIRGFYAEEPTFSIPIRPGEQHRQYPHFLAAHERLAVFMVIEDEPSRVFVFGPQLEQLAAIEFNTTVNPESHTAPIEARPSTKFAGYVGLAGPLAVLLYFVVARMNPPKDD